jgi:hypothetical protein
MVAARVKDNSEKTETTTTAEKIILKDVENRVFDE